MRSSMLDKKKETSERHAIETIDVALFVLMVFFYIKIKVMIMDNKLFLFFLLF